MRKAPRLRTMPPRLASLPPKLASMAIDSSGKERERTAFNPIRALYKTVEWRKLRWSVLLRDLFTCQMCGRIEADTSKLVADHKQPHRGDLALFWDEANLWTLCSSPCHASVKQREEQAAHLR